MNEDYRVKRVKTRVRIITPDNIEDMYKRFYNRFLYLNSDNVEVNGKVENDQMRRKCLLLPADNGEPNIKTASADGLIGGFPLSEIDFINKELKYISLEGIEDLKLQKQVEAYLHFLHLRKEELQKDRIERGEQIDFKNSPFVAIEHFEAFIYLHENFNEKNKIRWTYLYDLLSERMKIGISQNQYFTYINDQFEPVATRKNENANDPKRTTILNHLFDQYSKINLCDL